VAFAGGRGAEENLREMRAALDRVRSGQVTLAPVAFDTDAGPAEAGQAVGFAEGAAVEVGDDPVPVGVAVARALTARGAEIVTVLCGTGVGEDERARLNEALQHALPALTVEIHDAGLPVHRYVLAAE
jgi:hypothetical protein